MELIFCNIACTRVALMTFILQYPRFIIDCLLISICSATGQLYIFYTISKFGSITFVIIMTIRQVFDHDFLYQFVKKELNLIPSIPHLNICLQGLAILLSCLSYHHEFSIVGVFGILLVFGAVFLQIYCNNRLRAIRRRRAAANSIKH